MKIQYILAGMTDSEAQAVHNLLAENLRHYPSECSDEMKALVARLNAVRSPTQKRVECASTCTCVCGLCDECLYGDDLEDDEEDE
jgi:hypothetical protein